MKTPLPSEATRARYKLVPSNVAATCDNCKKWGVKCPIEEENKYWDSRVAVCDHWEIKNTEL